AKTTSTTRLVKSTSTKH
ncbi:glutamate--tRNA ligase, partial [Vibrio parahaemolyticus AQ3810]